MGHKNKEKYNEGDAPLVFEDSFDMNEELVEDNVSDATSTSTTQTETFQDDSVNSEIDNCVAAVDVGVENKEIVENTENNAETSDKNVQKVDSINKSIYSNLIKVRIMGCRGKNGLHLMYPGAIANAIIESNGRYTIVVSNKSQALIEDIIRNHSKEFGKYLSEEAKEKIIAKFRQDMIRVSL